MAIIILLLVALAAISNADIRATRSAHEAATIRQASTLDESTSICRYQESYDQIMAARKYPDGTRDQIDDYYNDCINSGKTWWQLLWGVINWVTGGISFIVKFVLGIFIQFATTNYDNEKCYRAAVQNSDNAAYHMDRVTDHGRLYMDGIFLNGKLNGNGRWLDGDGNVIFHGQFQNGRPTICG